MKAKQQNKKVLTIILAVVIIIVAGILFAQFKPKAAGQAISIGGQPYLDNVIDLASEERVTFSFDFEEEGNEILFTAKKGVFAEAAEYKLVLQEIDESMASISLFEKNDNAEAPYTSLAVDFLSLEGMDATRFYLDDDDATPDISVVYANGVVTLSTLHYLAPTGARIELQTIEGKSLPLIYRVQPSQTLLMRIKATSIFPPAISVHGDANVTIINASVEVNPQGTNYTIAYINYTAPAQSQADILVINASVLGRNNYAYYTFAVGNVIYALARPNAPTLLLWSDEQNRTFLNVTLLPTTALQPFAVPCRTIPQDAFFTHSGIKKIYSYARGEAEVAVPVPSGLDRIGDFEQFDLFRGYFIELKEAGSFTIQIPCANLSISPPSGIPQLNVPIERFTVQRGWNLLSLPGTIARPLTDFTLNNQFKLIQCAQGYACTEIERTSPLFPGQPYWIYTDQEFDLNYVVG